jgi:hypothetical protein
LVCGGLAFDGDALFGQAVFECLENLIAFAIEPFEVLDAGEPVLALGWDVGRFELAGMDGLFCFRRRL